MSYPVIYAPSGMVIGYASTRLGAIRHCRRIGKLKCERWTATLADVVDRTDMAKAWFVGPVLIERRTR